MLRSRHERPLRIYVLRQARKATEEKERLGQEHELELRRAREMQGK
jgi:hypothetical protein